MTFLNKVNIFNCLIKKLKSYMTLMSHERWVYCQDNKVSASRALPGINPGNIVNKCCHFKEYLILVPVYEHFKCPGILGLIFKRNFTEVPKFANNLKNFITIKAEITFLYYQ